MKFFSDTDISSVILKSILKKDLNLKPNTFLKSKNQSLLWNFIGSEILNTNSWGDLEKKIKFNLKLMS